MTEYSPTEWVQKGLSLHQQGDLASAEVCYRRALELDPSSADGVHFFGMAKWQSGEPFAAEDLIRQSIDLKPGSAIYRYNLGQFFEGQGRLDEALWAYEIALTLDPGMAAALNERGRIFHREGRLAEAETSFREALAQDPGRVEAHTNLGRVLWERGDLPAALEHLDTACRKAPGYLPGHFSRMSLLVHMGRVGDALKAAEVAEAAGVGHPGLEIKRASAEQDLGDLETAADRLEAVLRQDPGNLSALYALGPLAGRLGRAFPREEAERLLESPEPAGESRSLLAFALGGYADSQGEYDTAFMYWLEGNQVEEDRASGPEMERRLRYWSSLREVFSGEVVEELAERGFEEASPIFVVGTPRSGTTLVEQILASHSRVTGVGESGVVQEVLRDHLTASEGEEAIASLTPERCRELGRVYWDKLRTMAPGTERIVDKTPGNAQNLGLIRALFPNARVIFTRRDPLDSGVSMFSLRFAESVDFAFDPETLGRYLQGFHRHMDHWRTVLPPEFLLTLDYEALVQDPETRVEQLLEHCGLEWEDECLEFFEADRAVRTASQAQVRQPIYRSAVQRWSHYQQHLLPLARAAGLADRLPREAREGFRSFSRLGERQWAWGQVQEAIRSFRRALMWEPARRGRLNARLGRVLEAAERYREAEACFRTALEVGIPDGDPEDPAELELARARCLRQAGSAEEARPILAASGAPEGPQRWTEDGWIHLLAGRPQDAETCFSSALAEAETEAAREGWARALRQQGREQELEEVLEGLAHSYPDWEVPARILAGHHRDFGSPEEAERWARRALELAPQSHRAQTVLATCLFDNDRPEAAGQALDRALALCPDHFPAHLLGARIHLAEMEYAAAEARAAAALGIREDPGARVLWGRALLHNGSEEKGLAEIHRVRLAHPEQPDFWSEEVGGLEELNRRREALTLVGEAREHFPEHEGLRFLELRLLRQEGADGQLLEGLRGLSPALQAAPRFQTELGFLYDRLGEPDRAMECFRAANERQSCRAVVRRFPKEVALSRIARLRFTVTEEWVRHWRTPSRLSGWDQPPVILLGFPRSGTTLLDQILSSHSQVEVVEEKPVFEAVSRELRRRFGGDLKGLAEMGPGDIEDLQELYRETLDGFRTDPGAPVVVDKMPLRTVEAGMVYRLFPDARFLFARRHPADCVLSGFMQLFAPNAGMANFHSLTDGARYYRAVMELWDQYRALFPGMRVHEIRYEELVEDFDGVVGGILDFLGLPWEEGVREYRDTARQRGRLSTPSRTQVTQALYRHARYRWRRYRDYFGSGWEDILPFIRAAGYPEE